MIPRKPKPFLPPRPTPSVPKPRPHICINAHWSGCGHELLAGDVRVVYSRWTTKHYFLWAFAVCDKCFAEIKTHGMVTFYRIWAEQPIVCGTRVILTSKYDPDDNPVTSRYSWEFDFHPIPSPEIEREMVDRRRLIDRSGERGGD